METKELMQEEKPKEIQLPVLAKKITEKEMRKRLDNAYTLAVKATLIELKNQNIPADASDFKAYRSVFIDGTINVLHAGFEKGETVSIRFYNGNITKATILATELQKQLGIEKPEGYSEDDEEKPKVSFENATIPKNKLPLYITIDESEKNKVRISWPPWIYPSTTGIELESEIISKNKLIQVPSKKEI